MSVLAFCKLSVLPPSSNISTGNGVRLDHLVQDYSEDTSSLHLLSIQLCVYENGWGHMQGWVARQDEEGQSHWEKHCLALGQNHRIRVYILLCVCRHGKQHGAVSTGHFHLNWSDLILPLQRLSLHTGLSQWCKLQLSRDLVSISFQYFRFVSLLVHSCSLALDGLSSMVIVRIVLAIKVQSVIEVIDCKLFFFTGSVMPIDSSSQKRLRLAVTSLFYSLTCVWCVLRITVYRSCKYPSEVRLHSYRWFRVLSSLANPSYKWVVVISTDKDIYLDWVARVGVCES